MGLICDRCINTKNDELVINHSEKIQPLADNNDFSTIIKIFFKDKNEEFGQKLQIVRLQQQIINEVDQLAQEYVINLIILDFCFNKLSDNQYLEKSIKFYFHQFLHSLYTFQKVTQHSNQVWLNFLMEWSDQIVMLYESVFQHWNISSNENQFVYESENLKNQLEILNAGNIGSKTKLAIKILQQIIKHSQSQDSHPFYLIQEEIAPIRERYFIRNQDKEKL